MRFTPQDEQFRAEVREWLKANLTGEFAGLRGASLARQVIFYEEYAQADAPARVSIVGEERS